MPEPYATGTDAQGNRTSYATRANYLGARANRIGQANRRRPRVLG